MFVCYYTNKDKKGNRYDNLSIDDEIITIGEVACKKLFKLIQENFCRRISKNNLVMRRVNKIKYTDITLNL